VFIDRSVTARYGDLGSASEIRRNFFKLRAITTDYFLYHTERAQKQWWSVYDDFQRLLNTPEYEAFQTKHRLGNIGDKLQEMGKAFSKLTAAMGDKGLSETATAENKEYQNRLITQIMLTAREIVLSLDKLSENLNEEVVSLRRQASLLDILSLLILVGFITANSIFLIRSVVNPVLKLHEGAEIIGAGNLDYKVGMAGRDEIGQLSQAFDRMTANLQQVTVSRDELAREVEGRKQVEAQLKTAVLDLERSNRDLEEFAYISSHDLQEPLRKIANFSDMLVHQYQGRLDERAERYFGYITDGAKRMQTLINDLLSYSRVGRAEMPRVPASLEDILKGTLSDLQALIQESGAEISHDPLPNLQINPHQVGQLLQNLIGNGIKFHGHQSPRIHLAARQEGQEWVISVRDNGIGFDPQYAEGIFKVFKRLHAKEEYPGTGIGLAVCKKIVERHGGRIWAESEPGHGATFYFTIPA